MPINQFNVRPQGVGLNQETKGTIKTGNSGYNDYYYMSPEYRKLVGGIGASNSSYGLRSTENANRLNPNRELYERTLGELVSTLVGNNDTTQVQRYVSPSRYRIREPEYISLNNINYGSLYKLGDVSDEIAKTQAIMRANGYNVDVNGVYDTKFAGLMDDWKRANDRTNDYSNTYGNKTIDTFNNAQNKVTVDDFNKMYSGTGAYNTTNNYGATGQQKSNTSTTKKTVTKKSTVKKNAAKKKKK